MMQTLLWTRAYGLGSGYDLNQLGICGFFDVRDPTNGPGAGRWFITSYVGSEETPDFRRLIQTALDFDDGSFYKRYYDGSWSSWSQITGGGSGNTILNGAGAPAGGTGSNGDFYIDTTADAIYGPKTAGAWGSPTSLVGPAGSNGTNGQGVPTGGSTGQQLRKASGTNYDTEWVTEPYDISVYVSGTLTTSLVMLRYVATRALTFPSSLTGSQSKAGTAATAQTDIDVQKNGSSVGTIRYAAAGTTASFISASGFTLAAGDVLTLVAPASADATLGNVAVTLAGTR